MRALSLPLVTSPVRHALMYTKAMQDNHEGFLITLNWLTLVGSYKVHEKANCIHDTNMTLIDKVL